jgi:hypothetical protein
MGFCLAFQGFFVDIVVKIIRRSSDCSRGFRDEDNLAGTMNLDHDFANFGHPVSLILNLSRIGSF